MNFKGFSILATIAVMTSCSTAGYKTDRLGIDVSAEENREYSYTDKKAGYWYGRTHSEGQDWYSGWNMAKKRILSDYTLTVNGKQLDRKKAECTVYPDRIVRRWDNATETFRMVDNLPLIHIRLETDSTETGIQPDMGLISLSKTADDARFYTPHEAPDMLIMIGSDNNKGFIISYGATEEACRELHSCFLAHGKDLIKSRKDRIDALVTEYNPVKSNLTELDKALDWIIITMDELITEQQGNGIYAGLPWFNEYWGRDMFISMPGACLVTGQFDVAKEILKDFAKLQDKDPDSETYGRIPNRANLESILYNTTDGTPRFVSQALELAEYSGDTEFLADIYPAIKTSIDASIANYTDENGYLTHADADTWMDVKRNGIPGSPRGNRANDIQALWYDQLVSGSKIATIMGDIGSAEEWSGLAQMLASRFEQDFCDKKGNMIYDHLNIDGSPDIQFRPNQLYCFDLVNDKEFKKKLTRRTWEELVYPWGVSSLAQWDKQFHPQHENWNYYHKDDAYHNGTIWLWNNGIAMQRMLEYGQIDAAWKLFKNMNRQALHEGAVGSLSENADAHPREGQTWVNRSGTFLQAWSNAEHLRIWYQYFLGIRPDLLTGVIVIEPKLPAEITSLETSVKVGKGTLHYKYKNGKIRVKLDGVEARLEIHDPVGQTDSPIFEGMEFCKPNPLEHYPCFDTYYETALTY